MVGFQYGEIQARPGSRKYLISAGFLKFGRLPNGRYNFEKIIRRLGAGGGLTPANFPCIFRYPVVYLRGLLYGEIHIRTGIWGYLISAGFLKFGRLPNGR